MMSEENFPGENTYIDKLEDITSNIYYYHYLEKNIKNQENKINMLIKIENLEEEYSILIQEYLTKFSQIG